MRFHSKTYVKDTYFMDEYLLSDCRTGKKTVFSRFVTVLEHIHIGTTSSILVQHQKKIIHLVSCWTEIEIISLPTTIEKNDTLRHS